MTDDTLSLVFGALAGPTRRAILTRLAEGEATVAEIAAPPGLVFPAHVEPELLTRWLGPRDLTLAIDRWDARDGGTWRYVNTDAGGTTYGFHGVFHGDPSQQAIV